MGDKDIDQEIQAKGLTAPRVTPADIEANIESEHYFTAAQGAEHCGAHHFGPNPPSYGALGLLTFCVLVLRNGFTVTGESACASPENFDAEVGRKIARQNAVQKIWPLMGYELRSRLHQRALYEAEPKVGYGNEPKPTDCPHAAPCYLHRPPDQRCVCCEGRRRRNAPAKDLPKRQRGARFSE